MDKVIQAAQNTIEYLYESSKAREMSLNVERISLLQNWRLFFSPKLRRRWNQVNKELIHVRHVIEETSKYVNKD